MRFLILMSLSLICSLVTLPGMAKPWEFVPSSRPLRLNAEELRKNFPDIQSPEDLSNLLKAISLAEPMAEVTAEDGTDRILIKVVTTDTINDIRIYSLTRSIRLEVENKLNKYIGLSDSQELRKQLSDEIFKVLKEQGYYLAKVQIAKRPHRGGVLYEAAIDEDFPCTIAHIDFSFRLPNGVQNPYKIGMYCDAEEIRGLLTQLEESLVDAGYNQQRIQSPDIVFNSQNNTATLKILGSLGKKILVKINSPIKSAGLVSAVFGDDLNSIDPSITDPDAMASEITRQYKAQGYDDVEIRQQPQRNPDPETIEYQFDVKPGPEYMVTEVQFEGLNALAQEEATEAMGLSAGLSNQPIFSQDLTQKARETLQGVYKERGFWDAKVFDPRVIKNPSTGEVKLVYVVKEGKRRLFDGLVVTGNQALRNTDIEDMLLVDEKDPLAWQQLIDFEKTLRTAYRNQGYLQVQMNIELIQNRQFRDIETKVLLNIQEGPRAKFGEISVKGLVKTDSDIVTRELRFKNGDWFDPAQIEESRQALVDLGLFSSVSITPSESNATDKTNTVAYTVIIREARSGTVSFGPGWSLNDGMRFSIESAYNNIGGRGRKIFSKGSLNEEKTQTPLADKTLLGRYVGVGYIEPWLLDYPVDGTLTFNHKGLARDTSWEVSRAAEAIASHRIRGFTPRTDVSLFTLYKEVHVEAEEGVKRATLIESGSLQVREIGLRHITDGRNNLGWPTKGFRLATEFSVADFVFGGDIKYNKWSIGYNVYQQIFENFVVAVGTSYTSYNNIRRRDAPNVLPNTERLLSGGPDTNRGFRENSLGPVLIATSRNDKTGAIEQTDIFDGGSRRATQRLEFRYQLIQDAFALTTFLDANNSFFSPTEERLIRENFAQTPPDTEIKPPELYDNEPYQLDDLIRHPQYLWTKNYLSYGLAGNILTPLGSANISVGWPWRRCLNNAENCPYPRGNSNYRQLRGAVIGINVGATF
ncbi:MAG TPA: POTRA domain-containing protein [Oligoflexus sp.]|uniref:BamA/OMP85 family outer membrane protein n=1 Tax=Oligoflexus sp. TaxID=1971216 RepID=UPI002D24A959|nr:POTRA domain-containing protein [Oligoflexus sp.]HYX39403.1 POTRA domain-containing protein [Oligoflexus sp.]